MPDKLRFIPIVALLLSLAPGAAPALPADGAARMAQSGPAAPEASPADPPAAGSANEPAKTVLEKHETQGILGKTVRDSAGKEMGRIVNVIVDRASQPRAVVIDFGGFLGVGSRKIAVDWAALRIGADKPDQITLDLSRDQVRAAPEYKDGAPVVVLGAAGGTAPLPSNGSDKAEP